MKAKRRLVNGVSGTIGASIPFAIAARMLRPDAPVGTLLLNGTLTVRESVRRIRQGKRRTAVEREGLYDA